MNSIDSVLRCMDRPMVYSELLAIQRSEVGRASGFNVVPMYYYANLKVRFCRSRGSFLRRFIGLSRLYCRPARSVC